MLQSIRERITLLLLVVLPLHALLVTVLTRVFVGRFQDTPLLLSMWKEIVLIVLLSIAVFEIVRNSRLRQKSYTLSVFDYLLIAIAIVGLGVSFWHNVPLKQLLYGIKYNIWPLALVFVFSRVGWSAQFRIAVRKYLLWAGVIVGVIGLIFLVLPAQFLQWLGYSETHSLFMAHKPVAAFQQIGGSSLRRLQSTLSGPNQAGIWLLIPLSFLWVTFTSSLPERFSVTRLIQYGKKHTDIIFVLAVVLTAIVLTFSRSAWIASLLIFTLGLFWVARHTYAKNIATGTVVVLALIAVVSSQVFPHVIKRDLSSRGHLEKPLEALHTMIQSPFGLGLGSAGPVSNHLSDSCTIVDVGSDTSWSNPYPELCLFADGKQIKPLDRTCSCPRITENWYLQWGVEMGFLGFLLSIAVVLFVVVTLRKSTDTYVLSVMLAYIGVATVGLFLHSFEDSSVAYTLALLFAPLVPRNRGE